jgi:hypothetical protein
LVSEADACKTIAAIDINNNVTCVIVFYTDVPMEEDGTATGHSFTLGTSSTSCY